MLTIWLIGAIAMFVSSVLFDRHRLKTLRALGRYYNHKWGWWERVNDSEAIMNALVAYLALAVLWPVAAPIAILAIGIAKLSEPNADE